MSVYCFFLYFWDKDITNFVKANFKRIQFFQMWKILLKVFKKPTVKIKTLMNEIKVWRK